MLLASQAALLLLSFADPIEVGASKFVLPNGKEPLTIYAYKPKNYTGKRMIMVFHGTLRNADEYRDHAIAMGDRFRALIIAPEFDSKRFPSWRYQRGGLINPEGNALTPKEWTFSMIPKIYESIKEKDQNPDLKYWIIGHSAGGQFVSRMAAFVDTKAQRIVAANPGSQLFPALDAPYGYGFGKLPPELANPERLKFFLCAPLTLYMAKDDNVPDEYFDASADAMKQGPGRYQRGIANFNFASNASKQLGVSFGWKFVDVDQIAHDHERMFNAPECEIALFGRRLNLAGEDFPG